MKTSIKVLFKSMQKDDKKEVLKFEIKGQEDAAAEAELFALSGSIVVIEITGCEAGEVTAEFMNIQRDSKKTVLKFAIKGDIEEKAQQIYKFAGRNVELGVQPSQMSIEEFRGEDEHEGLEYDVHHDGTVSVKDDENQLTIDKITEKQEQKAKGSFLDDDSELERLEE
jgi:hypothetical protein